MCSVFKWTIITEICKCGNYPEIPDHMKNGRNIFNDDLTALLILIAKVQIALCMEYL